MQYSCSKLYCLIKIQSNNLKNDIRWDGLMSLIHIRVSRLFLDAKLVKHTHSRPLSGIPICCMVMKRFLERARQPLFVMYGSLIVWCVAEEVLGLTLRNEVWPLCLCFSYMSCFFHKEGHQRMWQIVSTHNLLLFGSHKNNFTLHTINQFSLVCYPYGPRKRSRNSTVHIVPPTYISKATRAPTPGVRVMSAGCGMPCY